MENRSKKSHQKATGMFKSVEISHERKVLLQENIAAKHRQNNG